MNVMRTAEPDRRVFTPVIDQHASWIAVNPVQGCPKRCEYCFLHERSQAGVAPVQQASQPGAACPPPDQSALEPLFALHAGFRTGGKTVVLHKFGIDPGYDAFRSKLLAGLLSFSLIVRTLTI